MELKNVQVKGDQLEFEVLHRTGIWMRITVRLIEGKLQGEGIPVDFDLGQQGKLGNLEPLRQPGRHLSGSAV